MVLRRECRIPRDIVAEVDQLADHAGFGTPAWQRISLLGCYLQVRSATGAWGSSFTVRVTT